jgi:hypothetical protein
MCYPKLHQEDINEFVRFSRKKRAIKKASFKMRRQSLKKSPSSFASYVSVSLTDFPLFISQFLPELDSAAFAFP